MLKKCHFKKTLNWFCTISCFGLWPYFGCNFYPKILCKTHWNHSASMGHPSGHMSMYMIRKWNKFHDMSSLYFENVKNQRESLSLSSSKISFLYICLTKWRYVMYLCRCILSPSSCQRVLKGILGGENIDSFMVLTNVYEQSINASRHAVVKFLSLWHVWRSDGKEMIALNAF